MNISKRIEQLIEDKGVTPYVVSEKTKIAESTLSRILGGETKKPNIKNIQLLAKYFQVSEDWLLTGQNAVSEPENNDYKANNIEVSYLDGLRSSVMMVPLVNQYAYGSYLSGYGDPEFVENLPKIPFILDKEYKGEYLCFEMKGDSMEDDSRESLEEGDILLCRNVRKDFWKSKLHIKQWDFVIVHKERGVVAKRIISHNVENGEIVLHSLNEFYNDYTINLNDVDQIFNIVDVQKKRKRR